jgi:hypothetical protein
MYWIIGLIVYLLMCALYILFNLGAHRNDPDDRDQEARDLSRKEEK